MKMYYILNKDITSRTATTLNWDLSQAISSVRIVKGDRIINGKSLVDLLLGDLKINDNILVLIENIYDKKLVKEVFDKIGREVQ